MISFSRGLSPGHAKVYYTRELAAPENQLSAELETGRVRHEGAVALHLGLIDPRTHSAESFRNLCDGLSPDGEDVLVAPRNGWEKSAVRAARGANVRNAGWDVNLSPHKSVSVAALVLGDERIVDAHREAVRKALEVVEGSICTRTRDGRKAEPTGALLATTFDHGVSRELDPQLHTHVFVHNITVDRSGRTRAVYIPPTFRARERVSAAYQETLDLRLQELGYRTSSENDSGAVRIEGIPQQILDRFSTRSRQAREQAGSILQAAREQTDRKAPSARTLHRWAASASRRRKPAHIEWRELRQRWADQTRQVGIEPGELLLEIRRSDRASEPAGSVGREEPVAPTAARQARDEDLLVVQGARIPESPVAPPTPARLTAAVRSAAFAAREVVDALEESMHQSDEAGLRPLSRVAQAAGDLAAGAVEAVADEGFLARLRSAAKRRGTSGVAPGPPSPKSPGQVAEELAPAPRRVGKVTGPGNTNAKRPVATRTPGPRIDSGLERER